MSSTATTTTPPTQLKRRHPKRRMSINIPTYSIRQFPPSTSAKLQVCQPLPPSLDALDLSTASPTQTLASVRFVVLSYLADLEQRLSDFFFSDFELPDLDQIGPDHCLDNLRLKGEEKLDEARTWAREALEMLSHIRTEVTSHLPEFTQPFDLSNTAGAAMESFVKDVKAQLQMHLPGLHVSDVPFSTHLPDMPRMNLPEFANDLRSRLSDIGSPLDYLPQLAENLNNLHAHLSSDVPYSAVPSFSDMFNTLSTISADVLAISCDLPDALTPSITVSEMMHEGEEMLERAANDVREVARAIQHSLEGMKLITYTDLPERWKNNPFVRQGYR
ncbi:hypothetical protein ONZ45_g2707 [Pleurotus djamor]|nr:hypothetical protein ONZ45_g2707 [Pleurotus djamor]